MANGDKFTKEEIQHMKYLNYGDELWDPMTPERLKLASQGKKFYPQWDTDSTSATYGMLKSQIPVDDNQVFNFVEGGVKLDLFAESLDDKITRARKIREGMETYLINPETGKLDDRPSSHLMAHDYMEVDGKKGWYVWPTLFPGYENKELQVTEEWGDVPDKQKSFSEAMRRDELFRFDTEAEAIEFAEGGWKP